MEITKQENRITPMVTEHWRNKFDKSVRVLLKSGYTIDNLIDKIREIALIEHNKVKS